MPATGSGHFEGDLLSRGSALFMDKVGGPLEVEVQGTSYINCMLSGGTLDSVLALLHVPL